MTRTCWSCQRPHTGDVWCPHCSAPVDPGSAEAQRSPYWQADPRRPNAVRWPEIPGMDYRYGFPITPAGAEVLDRMGAAQRAAILPRLEAATFKALVRSDIEDLPTT